jgi:antitoxin component HigA of HigAB toxin-antitoxin module
MNTVDWGSNSLAKRNRLLFSDPHSPLSAAISALPDRTHSQQRVAELAHSRRRLSLDSVQQLHERAPRKGSILGFAHF